MPDPPRDADIPSGGGCSGAVADAEPTPAALRRMIEAVDASLLQLMSHAARRQRPDQEINTLESARQLLWRLLSAEEARGLR